MASRNATSPAPIAIVGMSCRLPGNASTLESFWDLILRCRDGFSTIPAERLSARSYTHPNPHKKGCFNQNGGYFLKEDVSKFDAQFFRISRQEALAMDPQQRLLLECTYEAFENAGIPSHEISGTNTGCFIAGNVSEYRYDTLRELDQVPMFEATGNHPAIQSGRVSHFFNMRGPCLVVDTACSSGLHALHAAVQSIRAGEATCAVVAASNLVLGPDDTVTMSMLGLFNQDGKTFAFDHRGKSGFARGEGAACLILKPLDQAIKDNDNIRSVIVNTGVGHDGNTIGLTTPSGEAQEQLMRDVYARANISPEDTGFIEAHGTGTKVGDPIEAGAIHRVFGAGRTKQAPLFMGSVKTNVGHSVNVSGLVSIIKASMMLQNGFILPNINFEKANEAIPLDAWNIKVPTDIRPWPENKRFISVNNFGFGGSNSHAVLERYQPPPLQELPKELTSPRPTLIVLSANDEEAAERAASQLRTYVEENPEVRQGRPMNDLAYTLGERRTHFPWRVALTMPSGDDLAAALDSAKPVLAEPSRVPKVAFVYTGQGAQWPKMGLELMESHPVFAATIKAAANHLETLGADFSLTDELSKAKGESRIGEAHLSQPVCTAVQLGLTALLSSWGVKPAAVTGHSSGEIVAAYAAGAISLKDAMSVAYFRGQVASKMTKTHPKLRGSMLAVGAPASEVKGTIDGLGLKQVTVACENSPNSVTASGDAEAVDKLAAELEGRGIFNRKLQVSVAYHSPHMQLVADDYLAAIKDVAPGVVQDVEFFSSLLGRKLDDSQHLGPSYWVDNLTKPVLLASSLHELCLDVEPDIIVEVGPHSALEGPVKQILKGVGPQIASKVQYMPSLVRNEHATAAALNLAGSLFVQGQCLDFGAVNQTGPAQPAVIAKLAPYPWSKEKHWFESRTSKQHRLRPFARHDLLGSLESSYSDKEPVWRNMISVDDMPWLKNHRMQSLTTFPLTGFLCMAVEAASQQAQLRGVQTADVAGFRFREIQVSKAFILDDESAYETRVSLKAQTEGTRSYSAVWDEFSVSSWSSSRGWVEHCRGLVHVKQQLAANPVREANQKAAKARFQKAMDPAGQNVSLEAFYTELQHHGAGYSSAFRIQPENELRVTGDYVTSTVDVPDTASTMPFSHETPSFLHPAFMDLTLQNVFAFLGAGRGLMPSLFMPTTIQDIEVSSALRCVPGEKFRVVSHSLRNAEFSIDTWQGALAEPVVKLSGVQFTAVDDGTRASNAEPRSLCYEIKWEPLRLQSKPAKNGSAKNGSANGHANNNGSINSTTNGGNRDHGADESNGRKGHPEDAPIVLITGKDASDPFVSALAELVETRTSSRPTVLPLSSLGIGEPSEARYVCLAELDAPLLHNMSGGTFEHLKGLLLACSSMLWLTRGAYRFAESPMSNIAQGLLRTVRAETGKVAALLDLDPHSRLEVRDQAELVWDSLGASLAEHNDDSPTDYEFAEDNGKLVVPRVVRQQDMNLALSCETRPSVPYLQDFQQPDRRLKVAVGTFGALDSLYWKDEPQAPLSDAEIEIKVACTGMNFKDVVITMGQVASSYLGVECSGTVSRAGPGVSSLKVGDRVCAMSLGAYGTFARCLASSAAVIPDNLGFDIAASLPVVFCTAYYGLFDAARLEAGDRILIHAASGGVGQAAIQLAQSVGAEIFATVGSADKKKLLMESYGIPESHVFYSRDASFGPAIKEATGGQGVDVVINSLAGDLMRETWDCLAPFGRFVEIGKRDINSNTRLEMAKFEHNCTFSSVDLTHIAASRPKIMSRVLAAVLDLLVDKTIRPIEPVTTVGISEVEMALRKLQSGQTTGKLVVDHSVAGKVKATHPPRSSTLLPQHATYVIIGGTGGLGRSMARRMVQLGARHIVLISRSGLVTGELKQLTEEAQGAGASIHVKRCDVADESDVKALVSTVEKSMPPIRGVIHAAMVLKDVLFESMTFEDYETVVRSKISGAWNMHNALLDRSLDFFVVLSSVSGIIGNRGQAAYAAANTFLDAFVRHRVRKGMAASALDLAAVSDAGYLAENATKQAEVLRNLSGSAMDESEVLAAVEMAMSGSTRDTCDNQCVFGLDFDDAASLPYYASDAKFAHLREAATGTGRGDEGDVSAQAPMSQRLQRAALPEEAEELVADSLREKLGAILMRPIPVASASQAKSIAALGLDSLNAIELRNWIGREFQAHLQVLELLQSGGLGDLAKLVLKKSSLIST